MSAQSSAAVNGSGACQVRSLPAFIQKYLSKSHSTWRVQESANLGPSARKRWTAEKPLACPGIASGLFDNTKGLSYALLLIPTEQKNSGYRLIVFNPDAIKHTYVARVVDQSENTKSNAFFIRMIGIGGFFDLQSQKRFQVQAREGILLIDAGENEYEADVYFWGAGEYRRQPVDY